MDALRDEDKNCVLSLELHKIDFHAKRKRNTLMLKDLHSDSFTPHLQTKFSLTDNIALELVEVFVPPSTPRQERFSLFFIGPPEPLLQQGTYTLKQDVMGTVDLFIVPIGKDERGIKYEAVFNRWIKDTEQK